MRRSADNPSGRYILDGRMAVECPDLMKWADWLAKNEDQRRVAWTEVAPGVTVSTVFLGLDHQWGNGPPMLFETMAFTDYGGEECWRYPTWDDAEVGHHAVVRSLQAKLSPATVPSFPKGAERDSNGA
jgi:hypothetical protein